MNMVQQAKAALIANPQLSKVADVAAAAGVDISDMKVKAGFSVAVSRAKKQIAAGDATVSDDTAPEKPAPKPEKPEKPAKPATTAQKPAETATATAKPPKPATTAPKKVVYSDELLDKTASFLANFKSVDEALMHIHRVRKLQVSRG